MIRHRAAFTIGLLSWWAVFAVLTTDTALATDTSLEPATALCHVCRVHDGEAEAEEVVATAVHDGTTYGFCSETCRDTFVKAPIGYVPPVFPRPAPSYVVHDLDGAEFTSSALDGNVVLLDFWATWCPPCVNDLPRLSALQERLADRGVKVISVSVDEGDKANKKVAKMVRKRKATHDIYLDANEPSAWAAYQVAVVPTQFLIDAEGQIVAQWSGVVDLAEVEAAIISVLDAVP